MQIALWLHANNSLAFFQKKNLSRVAILKWDNQLWSLHRSAQKIIALKFKIYKQMKFIDKLKSFRFSLNENKNKCFQIN